MAKQKITDSAIQTVRKLISDGVNDTDIRRTLKEMTGLSKSRGNDLFNRIKAEYTNEYINEYKSTVVKPVCGQNSYSYCPNEDVYTFLNVDYDGSLVREAKGLYCTGHPADNIQSLLGISKENFAKFRKAFDWTRNSEPITNEFIESNSVEESVDELLRKKRVEVTRLFEKKKVQEIESDATKWRKFSYGTVDKVISSLENWTPPARNNIQYAKANNGSLTMCVGLNDTHISELFEKSKGLGGEKWDTEEALKTIDNYSSQIINTINGRSDKFGKILVFVNGDYLNSCMDGKTRKGTQLANDLVNEEMFEAGLNALIRFVENLAEVAPVEVFTQKGNHDSVLLTYLAIAADKYFKDVKTVTFNISKAWASLYRVNNVAIILSHGGHDTLNRAEFPNANSPDKLKSYIQDLLLARRNELYGIKQIVIVTGHRHVFSQMDMGSFEFFCFGAMPASGNYENANNWHSTPRQNCIVLDKDRLKETLHFYFD